MKVFLAPERDELRRRIDARFDTMLAFTRVVELNSFTKAAVSLNLPKATVENRLSTCEPRFSSEI